MLQSTRVAIFAGLVILVGILCYLPGLSGPLLFDDKTALSANDLVKITGTSFDEWRSAALSSSSGPLKRPIAMVSFAANYVVEGSFSSVGLKAVNLAIHLSIAVLLFFLCLSVLQSLAVGPDAPALRLVALVAAAIWFLHPLNVSTVLYAVQRMAQLATLFVLGGLVVFMHYRERWSRVGASSGEVLAAALWLLLFTLLAMLSKENGALLPWLVIVLEVCIFRGVWAGRPSSLLRHAGWIGLVLPVFLVVGIIAVSPETLLGGYARREFTLEERLLTQGRLLWQYLGWIFVPNINDMGFQHDDIEISAGLLAPVSTLLALVAWLLLVLVSFLLKKRYPLLLLGVLFFLVGHAMESTVWPLEMVYEHRNYLPGMMMCLIFAFVIVVPATRKKAISPWYPILGVLMVFCLLLFIRVQTWSDELVLSRTNLAQHPESSRSNYFYANALLRHYRRADRSGLTERERSEYLLLSRHHFERMYQTNNRDVAALVMLFYLDSYHFPQMKEQVDWLARLAELLDTRTLQASDWSALSTLFEIFASEVDLSSQERVLALLDKLSARYPESGRVLYYRYHYLSSTDAGSEELLPLLKEAQALSPGAAWVYAAQLSENASMQDVSAMYDDARLWMLHDKNRIYLRRIKALFGDSESAQNNSDD